MNSAGSLGLMNRSLRSEVLYKVVDQIRTKPCRMFCLVETKLSLFPCGGCATKHQGQCIHSGFKIRVVDFFVLICSALIMVNVFSDADQNIFCSAFPLPSQVKRCFNTQLMMLQQVERRTIYFSLL